MRSVSALILLAVLSVGAHAQERAPVTGKCEGTKCDEFEVLSREVVGVSPRGKLIKARIRAWTLQDNRRVDPSEEDGYAFCSRRTPALVGGDQRGAVANLLAPLTASEYDRHTNAYATYFEICHGAGRAVLRNRDLVAEELGYLAIRQSMGKTQLTRPEDALSLDAAPAAEGPPVPPRDIPAAERYGRGEPVERDERYGRPDPDAIDPSREFDTTPYRGRLRGWPERR